jgi:hypothetical protein
MHILMKMEFRFNVRIAELVHELKKDEYKDIFSSMCDKADALKDAIDGDGCGLTRGKIIDRLMSETIVQVPGFEPSHERGVVDRPELVQKREEREAYVVVRARRHHNEFKVRALVQEK